MSFIVGVSGGTASGKSTVTRKAAALLGATLVGHDRYYLDVANPRGHNYDVPHSLDTALLVEQLATLKAGNAAKLPAYDFSLHQRLAESEWVLPADVVILEGILVLAEPALVSLMDLTVYVDCADDVRLERRLVRDVADRGRDWRDVLAQWRETVRPAHRHWVAPCREQAMLVLDGEGDFDEQVARLVVHVRGMMGKPR